MSELKWTYNNRTSDWTATTRQGVWTVKVSIAADYDHDWTMGRGKFYSEYVSPAKVLSAKHAHQTGYTCFMPADPRNEIVKAFLESGLHHIEPALRCVEAGKLADAQIQKDIEICIDPESHNLSAYGVSVGVYLADVLLGSDSLWGIESDEVPTEDKYILSVVDECIEVAMHAATKKLDELKSIEI